MPKGEKIGKDVIDKKTKGLMSLAERQKFEEFRAKREAEKKKAKETEELEGKKVETKSPEEKEPSPDELAKQREKEMEQMALKSKKKVE